MIRDQGPWPLQPSNANYWVMYAKINCFWDKISFRQEESKANQICCMPSLGCTHVKGQNGMTTYCHLPPPKSHNAHLQIICKKYMHLLMFMQTVHAVKHMYPRYNIMASFWSPWWKKIRKKNISPQTFTQTSNQIPFNMVEMFLSNEWNARNEMISTLRRKIGPSKKPSMLSAPQAYRQHTWVPWSSAMINKPMTSIMKTTKLFI